MLNTHSKHAGWSVIVVFGLFAGGTQACGKYGSFTNVKWARAAVSDDPTAVTAAIQQLRRQGPTGLDTLFDHYALEIKEMSRAFTPGVKVAPERKKRLERIAAAIEKVARQKDGFACRLYWHTDFDAALAAAKSSGRPILSLRLLGNLDDELSCANSRYFRTVLYANKDLGAYLRKNFVLHWKSVRPVPKITIDYGGGRTIQCTITGNSIHYVLDSSGRVIDGFPGLYGPAAFKRGLTLAAQFAQATATVDETKRQAYLKYYHVSQISQINRRWAADLAKVKIVARNVQQQAKVAPEAVRAQRRAPAKFVAEMPVLKALMPQAKRLEKATDQALWDKIAALHAADAVLDVGSIRMIRRKHPTALEAGALARTKKKTEDPMLKVIASFQRSVAEDTVRNEYQLHRRLHEWLAKNPPKDLDRLNNRVYAELFLTPESDAWLGLGRKDIYTALPHRGISQ